MKLLEKKQLITILIAIIGGLIMTTILLKIKYGEVNYWILLITGLICLIISIGTILYIKK